MFDPAGVAVALAAFGIQGATVTPLDIHGTTSVCVVEAADKSEFILKRSTADPLTRTRLVGQAELTRQLSGYGVPVAVPVAASGGDPVVGVGDAFFTLSPRLARRVSGLPDRPDVWRRVGAQLAGLHGALEQCAVATHGWTMDLSPQLAREIWPALDSASDMIGPLIPNLADRLQLADRVDRLPTQRLHGDMHGGNILLDGQGVYAVVDFDELPIGPRVSDVGYYAADLVKNRHDLPGDILEVIGDVVSGYHASAALSPPEVDALVPLMIISELRLLWWLLPATSEDRQLDIHLETLSWILDHRGDLDLVVAAATADRRQ